MGGRPSADVEDREAVARGAGGVGRRQPKTEGSQGRMHRWGEGGLRPPQAPLSPWLSDPSRAEQGEKAGTGE
jgi:hypothetical protein